MIAMQYQGGKFFVGKRIAEIINLHKDRKFYEPFCGGLGVTEHILNKNLILNDLNIALICLYRSLQSGYILPKYLSRDQYYELKSLNDMNNPLTAFAAIGCSWGAKWWGGYAKGSSSNYAANAVKSLTRKFDKFVGKNITFTTMSYENMEIDNDSVIYCDPPYQILTKFDYIKTEFNYEKFWQTMRLWGKTNIVYISHYNAPADFKCVLEIPTIRGIRRQNPDLVWDGAVERVWTLNI